MWVPASTHHQQKASWLSIKKRPLIHWWRKYIIAGGHQLSAALTALLHYFYVYTQVKSGGACAPPPFSLSSSAYVNGMYWTRRVESTKAFAHFYLALAEENQKNYPNFHGWDKNIHKNKLRRAMWQRHLTLIFWYVSQLLTTSFPS